MLYKNIYYEYNVNIGDFTFSNLKELENLEINKKYSIDKETFLFNHYLELTKYKTWYQYSRICNIVWNKLNFFENVEIYLDFHKQNYVLFFQTENLLYNDVLKLSAQLEKDNYCLSLTYKSWKTPFVYPLGLICSNYYINKPLLRKNFKLC